MTQRREPDATARIATSVAALELATVTDEELEAIRMMGDGSANHEDVYGFRMIASGDGLDFYFTQQGESSLNNYVRDLKAGQSLLGSHDIGTFSYGQSYDASIDPADPTAAYYEAAFYRQYAADPSLATKRVVVGKYFVVRGVELNGQKTDDLIKSMRVGGVRKASISFTVGRYVCSIDHTDMVNTFFGPMGDEGEGCNHFPGVEYSDGKGAKLLATAVMEDNDLLETSLVYKNASPSAMLIRKAEDLARQGRLPAKDLARLEERLHVRLPQHDRGLYPAPRLEDNRMSDDPTKTGPEPETPGLGGDVEPKPETPETPEAPDTADTPAAPVEPEESEAVRSIRSRMTQVDTRDAEIKKVLGDQEFTVETVRSLKADADLGAELYKVVVEEAVTARIGVQGEGFDQAKYRQVLVSLRDVDYVQKEIESYGGAKRKVFSPGRQVDPPPATDPGEPTPPVQDAPKGLLHNVIPQPASKRS